eukprot:scaffold91419_cov31-Phaeocystis_antarctica.AAC.1
MAAATCCPRRAAGHRTRPPRGGPRQTRALGACPKRRPPDTPTRSRARSRLSDSGLTRLSELVPMTLWVRVLRPEAPQLATVCL